MHEHNFTYRIYTKTVYFLACLLFLFTTNCYALIQTNQYAGFDASDVGFTPEKELGKFTKITCSSCTISNGILSLPSYLPTTGGDVTGSITFSGQFYNYNDEIVGPQYPWFAYSSGSTAYYYLSAEDDHIYIRARNENITDKIFVSSIPGDTYHRFRIYADGDMAWGAGTTDLDTFLERNTTSPYGLKTTTPFLIDPTASTTDPALKIGPAGGGDTSYIGIFKESSAAYILGFGHSDAHPIFLTRVTGNATYSFGFLANGRLSWGDGTNNHDVSLARNFSNSGLDLDMTDTNSSFKIGTTAGGDYIEIFQASTEMYINSMSSAVGDIGFMTSIVAESTPRFVVYGDGKHAWTDGTTTPDTTLERISTGNGLQLGSDDVLQVGIGGPTAPTYGFSTDSGTGMYTISGGGEIRFAIEGVYTARIGSRAFRVDSTAGTAATIYINNDTPGIASVGNLTFTEDTVQKAVIQWRTSGEDARPDELNLQTTVAGGDIRFAPDDGTIAAIAIAGGTSGAHDITVTADNGVNINTGHLGQNCDFIPVSQFRCHSGSTGCTNPPYDFVYGGGGSSFQMPAMILSSTNDGIGSFVWKTPKSLASTATLSAYVYWSILDAGACTAGTAEVCFYMQSDSYGNGASLEAAKGGTVASIVDACTSATVSNLYKTDEIVLTHSFAADAFAIIDLGRDIDPSSPTGHCSDTAGNDDMPQGAFVMGIELCYNVDDIMNGEN